LTKPVTVGSTTLSFAPVPPSWWLVVGHHGVHDDRRRRGEE
jgi:hypothetical protein